MGIDFDILLLTLWNVVCKALVSYFLQSDLTYSCNGNNKRIGCLSNGNNKRIGCLSNGNNKRIGCLSNDSTVLISVLSCLCKEFHIV